jgi:hypothetical protein
MYSRPQLLEEPFAQTLSGEVLRNRDFFWFWRRDPVLELQFFTSLRVVLLCFAIQNIEIAL